MSRRNVCGLALAAFLALGMAACGEDDADEAEDAVRDAATTVQSRIEGATRFTATLTGAGEVPGPGDPDGAGTATVNLDVSDTELCYEVTVQRLDSPTGMHIHEGESGKSGDVVVPLTTPQATDTTTSGCANVDTTLLGRIAATPGDFYVNVHTSSYPQGAIRGQLKQ